jgi:hypothetical protein
VAVLHPPVRSEPPREEKAIYQFGIPLARHAGNLSTFDQRNNTCGMRAISLLRGENLRFVIPCFW